jgi:hypothetical protein
MTDLITPDTPEDAVAMGWRPVTQEEEAEIRQQLESSEENSSDRSLREDNREPMEIYIGGTLYVCYWKRSGRDWDRTCYTKR